MKKIELLEKIDLLEHTLELYEQVNNTRVNSLHREVEKLIKQLNRVKN